MGIKQLNDDAKAANRGKGDSDGAVTFTYTHAESSPCRVKHIVRALYSREINAVEQVLSLSVNLSDYPTEKLHEQMHTIEHVDPLDPVTDWIVTCLVYLMIAKVGRHGKSLVELNATVQDDISAVSK
ncbi:uncharacterized protein B0J16DRAFT_323780 [Fusarium flagelliforme]|nr:uncharacterized protein B0J16DRAFT_323780 [Fusarium flagelliforme]KAH7174319.1 hypothetical protein B0J16DRAFT_323780 [Fusarium flagelliforme]